MTAAPSYRADIDGIRAIAVGAVVLHHAHPGIFYGGFIGVDIFFVISGFLITRILLDDLQAGHYSLRQFYVRRIKRIFPALALVLLAVLAFGWFALLAEEYRSLGKHVLAGAGFAANLVYWAEVGYFDALSETKPLLHLWSLGIEEQFYIVWPLILAMLWCRHGWLAPAAWATMALSFALCLWLSFTAPTAAFYAPLARAWELCVGALLAIHFRASGGQFPAPLAHRNALSLAGLGAVALGMAVITPQSLFPGFWALLPVLGTAALIAAGPDAIVGRRLLAMPPMVWLGLISYPLYLWHWPILSYGWIVTSGTLSNSAIWACVGLSIALAALTMWLIERPVRRSRHPAAATGAFGAVGAVALLGAFVFFAQGLPQRATIAGYKDNRLDLIRTPATDAACLAALGGAALIDYCRMSDLGHPKTVAVIGDSHAHVAFPGIAELVAQRGMNTLLLANSSCPPLVGYPLGETPSDRTTCAAKIDQIMATMAQRNDIDLVFITTRGPIYTTGTEPVTTDTVLHANLLSYDDFRSGLTNTAGAVQRAGRTAVYITENPELSERAESCQLRPLRLNLRDCRPVLGDVLARQKDYLTAVSNIAGLTTLNSLPVFCPTDRCIVTHNGALLYADDDHLSEAGSRFLAQNLLLDWVH